jgi:hypothetical protein
VIASIEAFQPYRNEFVSLLLTVARYRDDAEVRSALHKFFENLIPYMYEPKAATSWNSWDFDNFKFIIHELFLFCIGALIQSNRFETAAYLLQTEYYLARNSDYSRDVMIPFTIFRHPVDSLEARNQRLHLRRLSLRADLIVEGCKGLGIDVPSLLTADFVMFMRSALHWQKWDRGWWPDTLVHIGRARNHFEIFARAKSLAFFKNVKVLLGINGKKDLEPVLKAMETGKIPLPRWEFESINPRVLLGYDSLETTP